MKNTTLAKYNVGDRVAVKIGDRPLLMFTIVSCVTRNGRPHYKFDWAENGFHAILNTVAIPESSVVDSNAGVARDILRRNVAG